ncbi:aminopeptidase P N-terminal domain-containing protein [soil metagenome]
MKLTKTQKEFHASRRAELLKRTGKDSLIIVFSNTHHYESYDSSYEFKQNKNFFYLTGFLEPNAVLLMSSEGIPYTNPDTKKAAKANEILLVQKKDPIMETWNGRRMGSSNSESTLGIKTAFDNTALSGFLNLLSRPKYRTFYMNIVDALSVKGDLSSPVSKMLNELQMTAAHSEIIDVTYMIGLMRKKKTDFEIAMLQKACDITCDSYKITIPQIQPGLFEYQVQAMLEFNYKFLGGNDTAYGSIVASGDNANILHYEENSMELKKGDLLLIDSAAEYYYYHSDVTRTFPIGGKFSPDQRLIYSIVLKANKECIKACKPGVRMSELAELSNKVMFAGLKKAGFKLDPKTFKQHSIHGVGHGIGLNTHDAIPHSKTSTTDNDLLNVGDVVTIEPGLYFPDGSKTVDKKYWKIGVRIEDDILITKNGNVNLTSSLGKELHEIEEMMAGK